jgi:aromatic-L-amino-acid/L-tryptophan decarboxylase
MDLTEFRANAHTLVDWMADYLEQIEQYPVRSAVQPRDILRQLPPHPPQQGEPFANIFRDFSEIILPGMTHWQSPSFFAYFPANTSPASILAEMLTATMGAQCMSWITSPAATELEERMMQWLQELTGLPEGFTGVLQDTASTATLCSVLTAREVKSSYTVNQTGFTPSMKFALYASSEAHSSVEKAIRIAGFGRESLRKIRVDDNYAMLPSDLERAVLDDLRKGFTPLCVIAAVGTTGSTAMDPLRPIGEICRKHNIWLHIDAAFAGSALALPEARWMIDGIEYADTFVFNPHKWLFTNFDCSAYFVRDVDALVRTFEILPEYLKTPEGERVNNYRDWGIQLGRRFRALKLWFVIRSFGVEGLREKLRHHLELTEAQVVRIRQDADFELLAPVPLNTICFRYHPPGIDDQEELNRLNAGLLERVNRSGKAFLTHTKLSGSFAIRMVIGQTAVQDHHVLATWNLLRELARQTRQSPPNTPHPPPETRR